MTPLNHRSAGRPNSYATGGAKQCRKASALPTRYVRRRGTIMLVAMVSLALLVLLLGGLLRLAVTQRTQVRQEQMRLQAEWLAEAGVQRAVYQLHQDPDYTGETWPVSAEQLGGADAAEVVIEAAATAERPDVWQLRVKAKCPVRGDRFAVRSKQVLAQIAAIPEGSARQSGLAP